MCNGRKTVVCVCGSHTLYMYIRSNKIVMVSRHWQRHEDLFL